MSDAANKVAGGMDAERPPASDARRRNAVHAMLDELQQAYHRRSLDAIGDETAASACLKPLLMALGWAGMARHLFEALPHLESLADIDDVRGVLARLNYSTTRRSLAIADIGPGMVPCLFVPAGEDNMLVLLSLEVDGRVLAFDGGQRAFRLIAPGGARGSAYLVTPSEGKESGQTASNYGWVNSMIGRFTPVFAKLLVITFAINLLALSVPLYTMNVYNKAIGAKSPTTLFYFLSAVLIFVGLEVLLRSVRARTIAFLGARFESLVVIGAFQQLLHLRLPMTENSPVSSQITRLRQFGSVRDFFVGQLSNAVLDLPFAIVFLGAIFLIGGELGYLPLGLTIVLLLLAAATIPLVRRSVRHAGEAKNAAREFLMELTEKQKTIRDAGAEELWIERYRKICTTYLLHQFRAQQLSVVLQTVSQALVLVTGVLTVTAGTVLAIEGKLSAGALIAVVALIWRLLSPIQAVFLGLNRLGQTFDTIRQINNLMRIAPERVPGHVPTIERSFKGQLSFVGIGFRYGQGAEPAIRGISFDVEPGRVVAITGNSGAGKSTILKLAAGFYQPQAGVVRVDGLDLRQIDAAQYRHSVGYVPESLDFFHGTIAQNIRLADPLVSDAKIMEALEMAGAEAAVSALPEGINTRLDNATRRRLTDGFLQQLSLARAYVKNCPIYLFDDPGARLDRAGDVKFMERLRALSGKATVLLVTHRPSHMNCADRVIVLHEGQIGADGPPAEIVPKIIAQIEKANAA